MILEIKKTSSTPYIYFNVDEEVMDIEGVCLPDNVFDFYNELEEMLKVYNRDYLKMNFYLTYLNSPSIKKIFTIIRYCIDNIKNVDVNWSYNHDDEDIKENGEEFGLLLNKKFNFIVKY